LAIEIPFDTEESCTVITEFISNYVNNAGAKGVVVGLSGGIDSAVVALLCKKALGNEKVHCLFLPETTTPERDKEDYEILVKKFELNSKVKDISHLVKEVEKSSVISPDERTLANIKARLRMILLFEYANMTRSLVCGTSNKSELLIGYFTKYGDGGADIQPIGDLYKTQVLKLAHYLEIPEEIISKPPTAGLWFGQTDEKEIGISYNILDQILYGLELKLPLSKIAESIPTTMENVRKIKNLRIKTQHKRRTPLIPKIGIRTVGLDWRSPVQEG